jgi:hypothetical protein
MSNVPFTDMADDLDFDADAKREVNMAEAARERFAPAPKQGEEFKEPCKRCGGKGYVSFGYNWSNHGRCFACNGQGFKLFKTSKAERMQARDKRIELSARHSAERWAAFVGSDPVRADWIAKRTGKFDFATSLQEAVRKYGHLTDGQCAAVDRMIARDAERAAAKAAEAASRPVEELPDAKHLFEVMQKLSKIDAGDLRMSRRNQDSLVWLKWYGVEKVVGVIENGQLKLFRRPGFDRDAAIELLREFCENPIIAAKKYGKLSGRCCICSRDLTNDSSIEMGIGPKCLERMEGL